MGDSKEQEPRLSDRINRYFGINPPIVNPAPLSERFNDVAAGQNRIRKSIRDIETGTERHVLLRPDEATMLAQAYYATACVPGDNKLFLLLSDIIVGPRTLQVPVYSTGNSKIMIPLNKGNLKDVLSARSVLYHAEAADDLICNLWLYLGRYQSYALAEEKKRLLASLKIYPRNKMRAQIKQADITSPKIAGQMAKNYAEDLETAVKMALDRIEQHSNVYAGYAVCRVEKHDRHSYAAQSMISLTDSYLCSYLDLKPARFRSYFKRLLSDLAMKNCLLPDDGALINEIEVGDCVATYFNANKLYCLHLSKEGALTTSHHARPTHSVKSLPVSHQYAPLPQTNNVDKLLYSLTGGDLNTLAQLGALFSDVADPRRKISRFTVIHTKHNATPIKNLLGEAFCVPKIANTSMYNETSFNKLLTATEKVRLLDAQIKGERLIFVKDALPSDSRFSECLKLIKGEKIQAEGNVIGKQSFYNHLHFVCVTERADVAKKFAERCSANVIDLSAVELNCPDNITLSDSELQFMRTAFVLYGIQSKQSNANRSRAKKASIGNTTISNFMKNCCHLSKKAECTRGELYDAYCTYYQALHGELPKESSTMFIKAVCKAIPKRVAYKVKRCGEDKATRMCFVGLGINNPVVADLPEASGSFHSLLVDIGRQGEAVFDGMSALAIELNSGTRV